MAEQVDDSRRQVVPRWWPFRVAAALGQLDSAGDVRCPRFPDPAPGEIEELQRDWAQHRNPFHASNLVDAALVLGRHSVAVEAAEWLLENGGVSNVSLGLARHVLSQTETAKVDNPHVLAAEQRQSRIADCKRRLRCMPRNPLLLVDLAREYAALGQMRPARRALLMAVGLAPNNRFVLRSASRFFLHAHDPELAHDILLRAPATITDPWLVSAEIVAAQAREKQSQLVKKGTRLLQSARFHPRHMSELASAIGTLEHQAGNRRQVRKLFSQALVDPTENSVAQAAWIGRHMPDFEVPDSSLDAPRAFEARAWEAVQEEDFAKALGFSQDWLADEPFATRPALFGAWVAATAMGDYETAARLVETAMIANPGDPRLVAHLLYCKASGGDVDGAESLLPELERLIRTSEIDRTDTEWDVLVTADRGLLAYRHGDYEQGRAHYEKALEIASKNKLQESGASALVNYAREEALANPGVQLDRDSLAAAVNAFPPAIRCAVASFVRRIVEPSPNAGRRHGALDNPPS